MSWRRKESSHQEPWYCPCMANRYFYSTKRCFKYLRLLNVENDRKIKYSVMFFKHNFAQFSHWCQVIHACAKKLGKHCWKNSGSSPVCPRLIVTLTIALHTSVNSVHPWKLVVAASIWSNKPSDTYTMYAGIILCMRPVNRRRNVVSHCMGAYKNDPCVHFNNV